MRIVLGSSEISPHSKTGGLGDVAAALSAALAEAGHEVTVVTPLYRERELPKSGRAFVAAQRGRGVRGRILIDRVGAVDVAFVRQPEYYFRRGLYGEGGTDYSDNAARFAFLSRAITTFAVESEPPPDIVHLHDWQTALAAVMLKKLPQGALPPRACRTVLTVHNLGYQGLFDSSQWAVLDLPADLFSTDGLEFHGRINFLKGGLTHADAITTVSRRYAEEMRTPEQGMGLDGVLRARGAALRGILNGIDTATWDPRTDPHIPAHYGPAELDGKRACKEALERLCGFAPDASVPLASTVSRLVDQKGFDLMAEALPDLLARPLRYVVLGTGLPHHERLLREAARERPDRLSVHIRFDEKLAHLCEAGADIYLMPSRYEPCGLNQMMSLRYGTLPVVRATGGLDDTVTDLAASPDAGNGFKFEAYDSASLLGALDRALALFAEPRRWRAAMLRAMAEDHSWARAAREHCALYEELLSR